MSQTTYKPRTRVEIYLRTQQIKDIAKATKLPLGTVYKYIDEILDVSVADVVADMIPMIHDYAPKATGQLRNSLEKTLKSSFAGSYRGSGRIAQMKFGTLVPYIKYVANMNSTTLRHPKGKGKVIRRKRTTRFGRRGQFRKDPTRWRYVRYYGAPRWVRLEDRKAQTHFFNILITHIKKKLLKAISGQINTIVPASVNRTQFSNRMRPKYK